MTLQRSDFEDEESYLKFMLYEIGRAYKEAAKPLEARLLEIMSLRPSPPVIINLEEFEQLQNRLVRLRSEGLLDIKFDIPMDSSATVSDVVTEVNSLYEAVDAGHSSPLDFNDSNR